MAQVAYGTITITDTTDKNIFIRYSANVDGSNSTSSPVSNTKYIGIYCGTAQTETEAMASSTGWTWSEYIGTDGVSVTSVTEIYQLRNDSATPTKRSDGTALPTAVDTVNTWSLKVPSYVSGGTYWTSTAVSMSEAPSPRYTTPVKNEALTDSNYNSAMANSIAQSANENANGAMSQASAANIIAEGLQTRLKYMWMNEVNSTSYPAGSYMASGNDKTFSYSDSSTYGFNSFLEHTKLHFRYNAIDLTTIGLDGLKLYSPILNSGNTEIVNSKMGINITSEQIHIGGNGEDEEGYIIVDTDGMKIYSKYTPIIHGGTSVYEFDMVAQIGANTRIGALESGHMLLQSSGLWLKEKNNIIGRILNSSVHDLIPNYTEIFKFQWDINTTLQTSFESTFGVYYNTLSFLCGIQSEDDIIWGSSSSVTIDGTTYSFMLEKSFTDTFIPPTCTITSFQQNTTRSVTVVVQLTYTAATSGPYTSFGQNANVSGTGGFAAGIGVSSLGLGQVVLGQYNQEDFHAKFIIGNGTDDNNRSNLLVVDGDGNLLIQDGFKIVNTTGNCIQLTSDGMEIFKIDETTSSPSAVSVAKFGEITHVGSRNGTHLRVENNGLYLKDKALSIFQIKTEELDDGPEINLILYQNNNQLAAKERYSSGQSYLYRPKEVVIEFDDSSLSSGDTIDISTDFNGTASIYYNNQYNWVGLNGSGTLNITYGTSVNSLSYSQTISWQGTSRTITIFNLTYDGNNKIILETLTNSGASSDDASRYVRLNYYKNIKITASQQLSVLPATIIGPQELSHVEIDYHSLQMIDKEQNVYFYISDLRDMDGYGTVTDHFTGDGDTIYFPFSSTPASSVSVKVGGATKVYGTDYTYDRDIGVTFVTAPSNGLSVIINYKTTDSTLKAFTFGIREPDYGLGKYSVVEGYYCIASGIYSYATGLWTEATARCAHAEGAVTVANGAYSHAQNECTIASKTSQTVLGSFNVEDTATITTHPSGTISYGQYAIIVGNGTTSSARSNALTVDWQGNIEAAGNITGINVNASNLIASNSIQVPKGKNIYLENDNYINKFYCGTAGGTDNIYYKTDGYHAFFTADSTGRFYIQNAQVNSNVPYKAGGVKLFTIGWTTEVDNAQIAANGYADYKITIPSKSNYTPIAVVGYYFANATTNGANSSSISCNMAYYVSAENKARLMCRNHASSVARVRYAAAILYVATTQGI